MSRIYVGAIGVKITLDALVTLSSTAMVIIHYRSKEGEVRGSFPATLESLRYISYTTTSTLDLPVPGEIYYQGEVEMVGYKGKTEIRKIRVYPSL